MRKSIIVAYAKNRIIGYKGKLPWHLTRDLQHFRQTTWGHTVVMGRRTFESLPKPLVNRRLIVLTRQKDYQTPHATVCHSWESIWPQLTNQQEVFIAGGAQLYAQALAWVDKIYLTEIEAELAGDTHFPAFDKKAWHVAKHVHHPADAKNKYACTFWELIRTN